MRIEFEREAGACDECGVEHDAYMQISGETEPDNDLCLCVDCTVALGTRLLAFANQVVNAPSKKMRKALEAAQMRKRTK